MRPPRIPSQKEPRSALFVRPVHLYISHFVKTVTVLFYKNIDQPRTVPASQQGDQAFFLKLFLIRQFLTINDCAPEGLIEGCADIICIILQGDLQYTFRKLRREHVKNNSTALKIMIHSENICHVSAKGSDFPRIGDFLTTSDFVTAAVDHNDFRNIRCLFQDRDHRTPLHTVSNDPGFHPSTLPFLLNTTFSCLGYNINISYRCP